VFAPTADAVGQGGVAINADVVKAGVIKGVKLTKADAAKGTKNDSMLADNSVVTYTGNDGQLCTSTRSRSSATRSARATGSCTGSTA
jgi:hypothetical protein